MQVDLPPSEDDILAAEAAVEAQAGVVRSLKEGQGRTNQVRVGQGAAKYMPGNKQGGGYDRERTGGPCHSYCNAARLLFCMPQDPEVQAAVAELKARKDGVVSMRQRAVEALAAAEAAFDDDE